MQTQIFEIQKHIQHKDYSLAVRRMLDLSLDSNNANLLRQTIAWSKSFNDNILKSKFDKENFETIANDLLNQLATTSFVLS